jgi:D-glycero-D-manno-heptose 1,7-bisphosphate phosphatase
MNAERIKQPAAFIDRDGTLIEEVNFLSRIEDLRLFDFTVEAVRRLKLSGFLVIVVTNQSGIGRDIFDEDAMRSIHDEIQNQLENSIDAFFHCPHLPCDGCRCRKPELGMIEAAGREFEIDMDRSWMIGDKKIDVETGINAGISSAMVRTGYGSVHEPELDRKPDVVADNLLEAVEKILLRYEASVR